MDDNLRLSYLRQVAEGRTSLQAAALQVARAKKLHQVKRQFTQLLDCESWDQVKQLYPDYSHDELLQNYIPRG